MSRWDKGVRSVCAPSNRLRRWCAAAGLMLGVALTATPAQGEDLIWVVEPGDTLMDIAWAVLDDPQAWDKLQRLNDVADPLRLEIGSRLRIPQAWLKSWSRSATVATVAGESHIDGRPAEVGMRVGQGTQLSTGEHGHLSIALPDGSTLELPARSEASIQHLRGKAGQAGNEVSVAVQSGRIESRVTTQRGPTPRYRVETPTAVIGVRGTEFRVAWDAERAQTRAEVTTGEVAVSSARRNQARSLPAGYGVVTDARGVSGTTPLLPAPALDAFATEFDRFPLRLAAPAAASLPGVKAWRLQVLPEGSDSVVYDERLAVDGAARIVGLQDGEYRLRVRGIDAQGLEGFNAERSFTVRAHPEPPFMSQPHPRGKVNSGRVAFQWTHAMQAASYEFAVASLAGPEATADFSQALHTASVAETGENVALEPGWYAWRVASVRANGERGPWSDAVPFEVRGPQDPPAEPEVGEDELLFRWVASDATQRFEYQFAQDLHFREILTEGAVTQAEVVMPRPAADTYYMRIRSIDADGFTSAWSTTQRVVVPASRPGWMLLFLPLLAL